MKTVDIESYGAEEKIVHLMSDEEQWAIEAAIAARRPLLVRGEPGTGKTQLAYAAASELNRPLITYTVDSNTEARDLLWHFDAVQRLAEAQVQSKIEDDVTKLRENLQVQNFVRPGPLWWGIDWDSAKMLHQKSTSTIPARMPAKNWKPKDGVVILIDEIDKAESDVPNGLLEVLGIREFTPLGFDDPIKHDEDNKPPLIIITTNEERVLPYAFVRRCLVTELEIPTVKNESEFVNFMKVRGNAHFPSAEEIMIPVDEGGGAGDAEATSKDQPKKVPLTEAAAIVLLADRTAAIEKQEFPRPGLAEYLDFIRAVVNLKSESRQPEEIFEQIRSFVFTKRSSSDA